MARLHLDRTGQAWVTDEKTGATLAVGHIEATASPGTAPGTDVELSLAFRGKAVQQPGAPAPDDAL